MSVITVVSEDEVNNFIKNYDLGECIDVQPIQAGQTNSNYYLTLRDPKNHGHEYRFVLTIFENLSENFLKPYFEINNILNKANLPCACVIKNIDGQEIQYIQQKPAVIAPCLSGNSVQAPDMLHCEAIGVALARMHNALEGVNIRLKNPCDDAWYQNSISKLADHVSKEDQQLMWQQYLIRQKHNDSDLRCGIIHSDLFRDNVLFVGHELAGLLDFYYSYHDAFILDCATCVIDWCVTDGHTIDVDREGALCRGYETLRPWTHREHQAWEGLLQRAALRFWVARCMDRLKSAQTTHYPTKDPDPMKALLLHINGRWS